MPSPRDELIDAVEHGRLSPDEADAEALRQGLEPLSFEPPAAEYDPMREPFWTPVMVVAWIAWGTPDAVREAWAEFVARCRGWRFRRWRVGPDGEVQEGFLLEDYDPPSLVKLHLAEVAQHGDGQEARPMRASVAEARDRFLDALRTGALRATGLPLAGDGPRAEIPPIQWVDLHYVHMSEEDRFVRNRALGNDGYRSVLLPREQVVKLWKLLPPRMPLELPTVIRPDGAGYMTVFHALLWIATRGGAEAFEPGDAGRWQTAFDALMPVIASGHVPLTGERGGEREVIPPHIVAACRFDRPFSDTPDDLLAGSDLYLRSYAYLDEDHWRKGFDDALMVRQNERWTRLMVPKEDVAKIWPFSLAIPTRTGASGRPSSKWFILDEYDRQKRAGVDVSDLKKVAADLLQWLAATMPTAPRPTAETIRRAIRAMERERSAEARRGKNHK